MSPAMTLIVAVALAGLLALAATTFARDRNLRRLVTQLVVIGTAVVLLYAWFGFPFPPAAVAKGPGDNELPMIAILFVCMVLGMLAHWLHHWLAAPKVARPPFDTGAFLAPVLASPIVFIPLLASLQSANLDLAQWDIPRFMLFLVAFENGFFWKEYFDNRKGKVAHAPA